VKAQLHQEEPSWEVTKQAGANSNDNRKESNHKRSPQSLLEGKDPVTAQAHVRSPKQIRTDSAKNIRPDNASWDCLFSEASDVVVSHKDRVGPHTSVHAESLQVRPVRGAMQTNSLHCSQVRGAILPLQAPIHASSQQADVAQVKSLNWSSEKHMMSATANHHNVVHSLSNTISGSMNSGSMNVPARGHHTAKMSSSASMNLPTRSNNLWVEKASAGSTNMIDSDQLVSRPVGVKPSSPSAPSLPTVRTPPPRRHVGARIANGLVSARPSNGPTRGSSPILDSNHRGVNQSSRLKEW